MRWVVLIFSFLAITLLGAEPGSTSGQIKIGLLSAPSVIGRYSQASYNVALATFLASNHSFELIAYPMGDESEASISQALTKMEGDKVDAVLAPLTLSGVKNLLNTQTNKIVFIPTVHKRDVGPAPENFTFGAIDYQAQIESLTPYMANSVAIFYDNSTVGSALNKATQVLAHESKREISSISAYAVDAKGSDIVRHLARPSAFSKKSIVIHLPVIKTAMLTSHMTFTGVKERNILSTQMNFDPTLLTLTQYPDRQNMIIANSIIEQVPSIYESNALLNNDLTFDWINYTTSVGADYLISHLYGIERAYSMRIVGSQVVYPVELMRPKEFGFEPFQGNP
ncbi:MAG: hypothetical protein Q8K81_04490 [Sulfuricurvum sp.]|nr:hypothetical protein [Sulfuricurvum sp.]